MSEEVLESPALDFACLRPEQTILGLDDDYDHGNANMGVEKHSLLVLGGGTITQEHADVIIPLILYAQNIGSLPVYTCQPSTSIPSVLVNQVSTDCVVFRQHSVPNFIEVQLIYSLTSMISFMSCRSLPLMCYYKQHTPIEYFLDLLGIHLSASHTLASIKLCFLLSLVTHVDLNFMTKVNIFLELYLYPSLN